MRKMFQSPGRALLALVLMFGIYEGIAFAAEPIGALFVKLYAAGNSKPCKTGEACLWRKTSDDSLHYTGPSGADTQVGAGAPWFSDVDACAHGSNLGLAGGAMWTATNGSSHDTVGAGYIWAANSTVTGARTYWAGTTDTIKLCIWEQGNGTALACQSTTATATATNSVTFGSPVSVSAYKRYMVTTYDVTAAHYTSCVPSTANLPTWYNGTDEHARMYGAGLWIVDENSYHTGADAIPNSFGPTGTTSEKYLVEPVYTTP